MSKYRRAAKIDNNQNEIVKALRKMHGVSVKVGMDDILVGFNGKNYWYELKSASTVSKKTGGVRESAKKKSQIKLEESWTGQYTIVSSLDEIINQLYHQPMEPLVMYGEDGDVCDCGHLYCYHCCDDPEDGTVAGCQVTGCTCKNTKE